MELLLRVLRPPHIFHRAGPSEEDYSFYAAGRVLVRHSGSIVRSGLRDYAIQSAVAGVCKGGQAMGRYGLDRYQSGVVDSIRGGAIGAVDLLSAEQRREERGVEEVVLDDCPGHRGDIRR